MDKNLAIQAQTYLNSNIGKYIDDQVVIILQRFEKHDEKIIDFKEFKNFVKNTIKAFALSNLDISTLEASKRNVRETYMYRDMLDTIYASYIQGNKVDPMEDLIMNCLNELRGGCTNSLKGETEDTISKIKVCMAKIDDFNERKSRATSTAEKARIQADKETYIKDFDQSMKKRAKQSKDIERPSEKDRPMNPAGKNRIYANEHVIINALIKYIKKMPQKTIIQPVEVTKTKIVEKFIQVPVEKEVYVAVKSEKPEIKFDGKSGLYVIKTEQAKNTFKPTLAKKHIKQFRTLFNAEYKDKIPPKEELEYDPTKVIDVNIYALLGRYDKEQGTNLKNNYVKEIIRLCRLDASRDKEVPFNITYDLSEMNRNRSLGKGLTGMVRKHRIKNFAHSNGQDGIGISKYIRPKRARYGVISKIHGRRGALKPSPDLTRVIPIIPPKSFAER